MSDAPAVSAAPLRRLDAAWVDWLRSNLSRGCSEPDLVRMMGENGFSPETITTALDVCRIGLASAGATVSGDVSSYRPDPIRIDDVNHPTVLDRTVTLAMRMQDPNVAVIDDFLSAEECASLIALAADRVKRSVVVSDTAGENEVHASRTSEGTWFPKGEQALVTLIEQRIEALTGIPAENGEGLQVLSYGPGAEYRAHHDYFSVQSVGGRAHIGAAGQRIATLVLYLNDVEDGGDTAFPDLRLSVKPRAGRALYFEFHNAAGQVDPRCLHAGMPVKAGRKWIATKWYRQSRWG